MATYNVTKTTDVVIPEVMADMISAKIPSKIVVTPFAVVDTTLEGVPGNTITVPQYNYIGDAEDVAEGVAAGTSKLTASTTQVAVKKAVKAVTITDEAKLGAYGDPNGEAVKQLSKSIASKMDADAMTVITTPSAKSGDGGVQLSYDGSGAIISYNAIVDAVDVFNEEFNSEKVLFVNPKQVSQLRKDANFISADKYPLETVMTGEIGKIANCRIVPSKKVALDSTSAYYLCPLVKLQNEQDAEDDAPAITIYMKRGVNFETARDIDKKQDTYSVDQHYAVALGNTAKVVLCKFKK